MRQPAARHFLVALLVTAASLVSSTAAWADRGSPDDDPASEPWLERREIDPPDPTVSSHGGPLWVAVSGTAYRPADGQRSFGLMLLLGLPLDRLARSRPRAREGAAHLAEDHAPAGKAPKKPAKLGATEPTPERASAAADPEGKLPRPSAAETGAALRAPLLIPVTVTAGVAKAAVRAALRRARLEAPDARLDELASRARSSALLPELRLRATRLVDEAQSVAPTEYDPSRTTSSGGASLWMEARATWRLDRLVFADDELALERLRYDRADAQNKVVARVLELLFAWQRARALEADGGRAPEEHLADALKVLECEAALDVETDGWFSRWSGRGDAARAGPRALPR